VTSKVIDYFLLIIDDLSAIWVLTRDDDLNDVAERLEK